MLVGLQKSEMITCSVKYVSQSKLIYFGDVLGSVYWGSFGPHLMAQVNVTYTTSHITLWF